jgi:antitoxin ParD1/3/4
MPTRNVVITDHQAELIDRLVASGRYQNASEVLRAGLRLVEREDGEYGARLAALRAAVQAGIDAIEAGDYIDFETPEEMRRHLRRIADQAIERAGK